MMFKLRFLAAMLGLFLAACSTQEPPGDCRALEISDAWVREAPPGVAVMAAYMTLANPSERDIVVTSASSDDFSRIEFHQSLMLDDTMKMEKMQNLTVPAQGNTMLEPGGKHMMLFIPARRLQQGDSAGISLHCTDGKHQTTDLPVLRPHDEAEDHSQHH